MILHENGQKKSGLALLKSDETNFKTEAVSERQKGRPRVIEGSLQHVNACEHLCGKYRRRQWQPTPELLPGESQGRGSLVGCRLWGHTEPDTTERLSSSSGAQDRSTCI